VKACYGFIPLLRSDPNSQNELRSRVSRIHRLKGIVQRKWLVLECICARAVFDQLTEIPLRPITLNRPASNGLPTL
jgi:hypothetical protein